LQRYSPSAKQRSSAGSGAERLARILSSAADARWSPPGSARWYLEEREQPWPAVAVDEVTRRAVGETIDRLLS
jgi:hypothetical protein